MVVVCPHRTIWMPDAFFGPAVVNHVMDFCTKGCLEELKLTSSLRWHMMRVVRWILDCRLVQTVISRLIKDVSRSCRHSFSIFTSFRRHSIPLWLTTTRCMSCFHLILWIFKWFLISFLSEVVALYLTSRHFLPLCILSGHSQVRVDLPRQTWIGWLALVTELISFRISCLWYRLVLLVVSVGLRTKLKDIRWWRLFGCASSLSVAYWRVWGLAWLFGLRASLRFGTRSSS